MWSVTRGLQVSAVYHVPLNLSPLHSHRIGLSGVYTESTCMVLHCEKMWGTKPCDSIGKGGIYPLPYPEFKSCEFKVSFPEDAIWEIPLF